MTAGTSSGRQVDDISTRQWQAIFDAINDAVWLLDKDMRIIRSNRAAARFFARETGTMLGRHCWEIVHGTREPAPECPYFRMRRSLRRESCQSASKIDPPSACKIDPPQTVVFSW